MQETKSLSQMVDQDLEYCQTVWQDYSHDGEVLMALFFLLLQHYHDVIDGFDEGLCVMQNKEPSAEVAEICRRNIQIMMERLFAFRENGLQRQIAHRDHAVMGEGNSTPCPVLTPNI